MPFLLMIVQVQEYSHTKKCLEKLCVFEFCCEGEGKNFIDTFWLQHFTIWRLEKKFSHQLGPAVINNACCLIHVDHRYVENVERTKTWHMSLL